MLETFISNRELALLIWLLFLVGYGLALESARTHLLKVVSIFFSKQIIRLQLVILIYIALQIYVLSYLGFWSVGLLIPTIIWLYSPYQSLFQDASKDWEKPNFVKEKILGLASHTAILEYIIGFKSFPLLVEILMLPALTFIGSCYVWTEQRIEYKGVNRLFLFIISGYTLFALSYSIWHLYIDWSATNFWGFIFTFVMSLAFLPCVLMLRVFFIYENVFTRLFIPQANRVLDKKYIYWKALNSFGLNTLALQRWCNHVLRHEIKSNEDIDETVRSIKETIERESNPPKIDLKDGWSPYAIKDCLEDCGLKSDTYDLFYSGEWGAEAYFEFGDMPFRNRLAFFVNGTKEIATQLKLKFYCNDQENLRADYKNYIFCCQTLFASAFKTSMPKAFNSELQRRRNFQGEHQGKYIKVIFDDCPHSHIEGYFEIIFVIENKDTQIPEY